MSFCRDCLADAPDSAKRCPACRSPRLVRHPELATLAIAHIDEIEGALLRPDQRVGRADARRVIARGGVARKQQMIAVVDDEIERRVIIGATAPARHARGLVKHDPPARLRELNRAGKSGEPGADDMRDAIRAQPVHAKA